VKLILTEKQILKIFKTHKWAIWATEIEHSRAIAQASQEATLKAIGVWLEKAIEKSISQGQLHRGAEALERGEIPGGSK